MVDTTPVDPDKTAYGVIICVSGVACVMLLYMAVFGRRMRRTAIRWHVMNCSWWSMLHLVSNFSKCIHWRKGWKIKSSWRVSGIFPLLDFSISSCSKQSYLVSVAELIVLYSGIIRSICRESSLAKLYYLEGLERKFCRSGMLYKVYFSMWLVNWYCFYRKELSRTDLAT